MGGFNRGAFFSALMGGLVVALLFSGVAVSGAVGESGDIGQVNGEHAVDARMPSGAVVFFDATRCPSGWSAYTRAHGRTIVGLRPGGTLEGLRGRRLGDRQSPYTEPTGKHNHSWSMWLGKNYLRWGTWDSTGVSLQSLVEWADGIDTVGSGYFPLMPHDLDRNSNIFYYTDREGDHKHVVSMPYVQLLACRRN